LTWRVLRGACCGWVVYNKVKFGRILPVMVGAPLGLGRAP